MIWMDEIYLLSDNSLVLEKFIPLLINKDINNDNDDDRDDIDVWVDMYGWDWDLVFIKWNVCLY